VVSVGVLGDSIIRCNKFMKCEHKNVFVTETNLWRGTFEDGQYDLLHKEGEVTEIFCTDCDHEFTQEEIDEIQEKLNFN
jgi:hypothetical protein